MAFYLCQKGSSGGGGGLPQEVNVYPFTNHGYMTVQKYQEPYGEQYCVPPELFEVLKEVQIKGRFLVNGNFMLRIACCIVGFDDGGTLYTYDLTQDKWVRDGGTLRDAFDKTNCRIGYHAASYSAYYVDIDTTVDIEKVIQGAKELNLSLPYNYTLSGALNHFSKEGYTNKCTKSFLSPLTIAFVISPSSSSAVTGYFGWSVDKTRTTISNTPESNTYDSNSALQNNPPQIKLIMK